MVNNESESYQQLLKPFPEGCQPCPPEVVSFVDAIYARIEAGELTQEEGEALITERACYIGGKCAGLVVNKGENVYRPVREQCQLPSEKSIESARGPFPFFRGRTDDNPPVRRRIVETLKKVDI